MKSVALACLAVLLLTACRDQQPLQPPTGRPTALIMDGAHHGGNPDFFFLPPLAADPTGGPNFDPGKFNPNLSPTAEVCRLTGDPAAGAVDCATDNLGRLVLVFGPTPMALGVEQYLVNWDTKAPVLLDASKFYRIIVRGAPRGTVLGLLDMDPVTNGLKNVRTGEVVQFQDGRSLPIKVRIEDGAFGSTNPDHVERVVGNVATTVTTNTGFAGASFPENWLPLGALDAGINQVVLIIERIPVGPGTNDATCLQSGLMEREGCYRFRTDPDLHDFGPFSQLVTAGVCFEAPELIGNANGPPLELHRRVEIEGAPAGPTIDLAEAPATFLTCARFGPTPPPIGTITSGRVLDVARAGWHALVRGIGRLVTPGALHAVDLGAGGRTNNFSRIGWARHVTMTKVEGTDGNSAPAGTTVTPDPAVCLTLTHHGVSSPLGNEPVTFTVMTGGGTVGGLQAVTVNTDVESGCAHAAWRLGTTPGPNTLTAAGLASGSPLTFTAIATVSSGKLLYVANEAGNNILVFEEGASGNATPTATIAGGNTGLDFPYGVAHDGAGNIYATNSGSSGVGSSSITVYAAGANGDAAPIATIRGSNTGLNFPLGIALDGAGNIYVANFGASNILIFAARASGNVTPIATIAVASPCTAYGVALDGAGNLYVTNFGCNNVLMFAAGSGNATLIAGGNTELTDPAGIALDGAGNIYVANPLNSNNVLVFAAGASGNVTPIVTIAGGNTGLNFPVLISF